MIISLIKRIRKSKINLISDPKIVNAPPNLQLIQIFNDSFNLKLSIEKSTKTEKKYYDKEHQNLKIKSIIFY